MEKVMDNLQQSKENLSQDKRAALLTLIKNKKKNVPEVQETQLKGIQRKDERNSFPLSFSQSRLWFMDQLYPESIMYNFPFAYRIKGRLDIQLFEEAVNEIIKRHEILRTSFQLVDGEPKQVVIPALQVKFEIDDLSGVPAEDKEKEALGIARKHAEVLFNLQENRLIRFKLICLDEDEVIFVTTVHHIIFDSWSMNVFLEELSNIYNAFCSGGGHTLPELPIQYADYTEVQLRWLQDDAEGRLLDYWKDKLGDEISIVEFPADKQRPQMITSNGDLVSFELSMEQTRKLRQFASAHNSTLNMVALAAFKYLIYRYTHQSKIMVGSHVANRKMLNTQGLIGLLVNTLVLCTDISENMSFADLLEKVKQTVLGAFENQDMPFERLVEEYQLERDTSRSSMVQIMYNYINVPKANLVLNGLKITDYPLGGRASTIEVLLNIEEDEHIIRGYFEYNTDLYYRATMERIAEQYKEILNEIISNADKQIREINMLPENEKQLVLYEFNNTCASFPREKTVVQLFEEQVERTPDNVAVVFENEQLTYKELNEKANILSGKLRALGVGPDDFVAVMTDRSMEMVAGIYGIIKSGGAYVPIDPGYPEDRIAYMLKDCKPKVILTCNMEINTEIPVIDLGRKEAWDGPDGNPGHVNKPDDLLYVIYTSGTTGKPKGVMIENKGVTNYCSNSEYGIMKEAFENGYTKIVSVTNMTFDIFVTEVILALLNGMTTYIANQDEQETASGFSELQERHGVEILQTTPSRIKVWLSDSENLSGLEKLKYIMLGGEKVEVSLVKELKKYTGAQIVNVYGPSETTVWSSRKLVEIEETPCDLSIGKPISNTQIYILNGISPCGIGVPGELCIAGDGLARGYLNNPGLTQKKFIDNPFGDGKLYRTGDLGRFLPDGNIEYLGRMDEQVKIRGFRIELGEIDSVLRKADYIKDTAVIAKEDKYGEKAIYAYIVSNDKVSISDVRETVKKELPEYMVPSYIMQIEKIPVTKNGKLDRRALPEIEAKSEKEYVAPRNQEETIICSIFAEILGLVQVGAKDNFFDLGGHSLRATRVINRIEAETGIRIALKTIFKYPTVEGLAKVVQNSCSSEYTPIPKAGEKDVYPIPPTIKIMYFFSQLQRNKTADNLPRALEIEGGIDIEKLTGVVQKLINRHEILRTSFHKENNEVVLRIHPYIKAEIEEIEMNCKTLKEVKTKFLEFVKPFDLSRAPLFRIGVLKTEKSSILLIDMHHIITDGTSQGVFVKEFNALYNGEELKPLHVQYKDWSEWMRGRDISHQKEYWLNNVFSEKPPFLDLPYDYERPKLQSFKGSDTEVAIRKEIKDKIRTISNKTGTTEHMVLLAGFMVMLSKYSGQEDIVVGSAFSGRVHKDTESMLGMFANNLPIRGRPKAEKTFIHFLNEMKEICFKAYENQEFTANELLECLMARENKENAIETFANFIMSQENQEHSNEKHAEEMQKVIPEGPSRSPLYDVLFILENFERSEFDFGGNKARYVNLEEE
ncbi:MAG TPA: amino acid adenylation domain-containing protein, partial [Clostridia bacterium]|nr:amino acid adenylation domain-containing protein [Clostridia bacterium]